MDSQLLTILLISSLIIINIVLFIYSLRLSKRLTNLLNGSNKSNLEGAIFDFYHEVKDAKVLFNKNDDHVHKIIDESSHFLSKWSLVPYNAYGDMGGDISFVLCCLDKEGNGFLLNSLHSRSGTRMYSKEIVQGTYKGNMSEEEQKALQKALVQDASIPEKE